jgi:hypothetical protein
MKANSAEARSGPASINEKTIYKKADLSPLFALSHPLRVAAPKLCRIEADPNKINQGSCDRQSINPVVLQNHDGRVRAGLPPERTAESPAPLIRVGSAPWKGWTIACEFARSG